MNVSSIQVSRVMNKTLVQVTNHEQFDTVGALLDNVQIRHLISQLEKSLVEKSNNSPDASFDTGAMLDELPMTHPSSRRSNA